MVKPVSESKVAATWIVASNPVALLLYVKPGAKTDAVAGEFDGRLKIQLAAPATEGKANARLVRFLSEKLGVPKNALEIAQGTSSRLKRVLVSGVNPEEAARLLA